MENKNRIFFLILLLLVTLTACNNRKEETVIDGEVRISSSNKVARLDGYWGFYPHYLLEPDHLNSHDVIPMEKIKVPGYWQSHIDYGTYHLILHFPESKVGELQAIYLPQIYNSYKVWINEELISANGVVAKTKNETVPLGIPKVVNFYVPQKEVHLLMQVSNFHYRDAGISGPVYFGDPKLIERKLTNATTIKWLSIGAFVVMGLNQIILFLSRRKERLPLYFGLFCLLFGLRYLVIEEASVYYFLPDFSWEIGLKFNFISIFSCAILFNKYFILLYPGEKSRFWNKIIDILSIVSIFIVLMTDGRIFTYTVHFLYFILIILIPSVLTIIIRGIQRKRSGARFIGVAFIVLMATLINDLLNDAQIINTYLISQFGMFVFIAAQSFVVSKQFASALSQNEILSRELEITQREILFTLGEITETRSRETGNHVRRVAQYSELLALKYGLPKEEAELIKIASPLHDVGKVAIPDSILNKPGKLTKEEFELVKTHSMIGYEMLKHSSQKVLNTAATIALTHHEKFDGSGYPNGLKGEEIPLYGRITAISDVFDALGSDRVYKKAWEMDKIVEYFKSERGKHFDPILVDCFLGNIEEFINIKKDFKDPLS